MRLNVHDSAEPEWRRATGSPVSWLEDSAVFFGFVMITIAFATTTSVTRPLIESVRLISIGGFFFSVFTILLRDSGVRRSGLVSLVVALSFLLYGLILAVLNGGIAIVEQDFFRDMLLILSFVFVFSRVDKNVISVRAAGLILFYGVLVVFFTVLGGGLDLTYPPRFVFDYSLLARDRAVEYSQGVSKFYGLMAIIAGFFGAHEKSRMKALAYIALAFVFIALCALGGARGDSLSAILITLLYMLLLGQRNARMAVLVALVLSFFVVVPGLDLNDLVLFSRLQAMDGGLGVRADLYGLAYDLIAGELTCSSVGCGFGYYQYYFGFLPAYYPHNFFLELAIVYGVPLSLLLVLLALYGVYADYRLNKKGNRLFILVVLYLLAIQLKSGTLLGAWWLMAALFFFCGKAIFSLKGAGHGRQI